MKTVAEKRRSPAVWIGTVAGTGYFPYAPGTVGSAVGIGLVAAFGAIPVAQAWRAVLLGLGAGAIFAVGVWSAGGCEKFFGRTDPGQVVIDEVVGQAVAFLLVPHASWKLLLAGFALFRLFDITKPFPASRAERLPAGWGIMVDDVVAGIYAMIVMAWLSHIVH
ncbi:MAG TPA: phosphatidylglycerophosphatase A [Terriglobia bacterium]|nr:phosphatidylglycerophosphatase A [Terriglobia bacterium]